MNFKELLMEIQSRLSDAVEELADIRDQNCYGAGYESGQINAYLSLLEFIEENS